MAADKGNSKTDTLVKVVLVFFISLLSFSVGTFVGKQVSDSDHRRLALEGDSKSERNVASTEVKAEEGGDKISEKEVENLTEEFVNKEKVAKGESEAGEEAATTEPTEKAEAGGYKTYSRTKAEGKLAEGKSEPSEKAAPHAPGKAAALQDATHKVAEKVASGEAPSDGAKEERKPASTLPSVASSAVGKYTIQVGAFTEESEAKGRAAELKGKGWNAFYVSAPVKGRTWYRVSVGLFNNVKSADEFRAQYMKEANTKDAIVQKVVQ